jgi:hypothetical protein
MAVLSVAAACTNSTEGSPRLSQDGPFVQHDPEGLIVEASWVDPTGRTPALPALLPRDGPGAVLIDPPSPNTLRIALNGSGCVPEVWLAVDQGLPNLVLAITISTAITEQGIQCPALATTHAFDIEFTDLTGVGSVNLVVTESGPRA